MNTRWIICCVIAAFFFAETARGAGPRELKAFPGAQGFGAGTAGGSGRHLSVPRSRLYVVTSLEDSGPGSLRHAVEGDGPRTVVFGISGSIALSRPLVIKNPYLTIAGETAPSPGIAVVNDRTAIMTHDVIIRHMRFFVGDTPGPTKGSDRQAIAVMGIKGVAAENIIIDHCSLGGAVDENFSTHGLVRRVTLSNSIIANSLDEPISSVAHEKGHHGKGVHVGDGSKEVSLLRSLLANNQDRNPRFKTGAEGEMVNCVVYGWGGSSGWNVFNVSEPGAKEVLPVFVNVIGNTYVPGPEGRRDIPIVYPRDVIPGSRLFLRDNVMVEADGRKQDHKIPGEDLSPKCVVDSHPIPLSKDLEILPRERAMEWVLRNAGPRPADSFPDDVRVIREVVERNGRIKKGIWRMPNSGVSFPDMPVKREALSLPNDPDKVEPDGRTKLEHWLEERAQAVEKPRKL